jgi:hypothetical protein
MRSVIDRNTLRNLFVYKRLRDNLSGGTGFKCAVCPGVDWGENQPSSICSAKSLEKGLFAPQTVENEPKRGSYSTGQVEPNMKIIRSSNRKPWFSGMVP